MSGVAKTGILISKLGLALQSEEACLAQMWYMSRTMLQNMASALFARNTFKRYLGQPWSNIQVTEDDRPPLLVEKSDS